MKFLALSAMLTLSAFAARAEMVQLTRAHACFGEGQMSVEKSNGNLAEQTGGMKFYNDVDMRFIVDNFDGTTTNYTARPVTELEILKHDAETGKTLAMGRQQRLVGTIEGLKCFTQPVAKLILNYVGIKTELEDKAEIDRLVEVLDGANYNGLRFVVAAAAGVDEMGDEISLTHGISVAYSRSLKLRRELQQRLGTKATYIISVIAGDQGPEVDGVLTNQLRIDVF